MTTTRPDNYLGVFNSIWSNAEGVLNLEIEERLKQGDCYASHAAWDYNGSVWFDPDTEVWYEEIWKYGTRVDTITGDSATNVIAKTLARHGVM
jgi:hypothetical protein